MKGGIHGELRLSPRFRGSGTQAGPQACRTGQAGAGRVGTETLDRHSAAPGIDTRGLSLDSLRTALRIVWPAERLERVFGLHDAHFEVVSGPGGPTMFLRALDAVGHL